MKKISVIIPCYNEAENIDLICKKVLEISYPEVEIEILFVDDGSTDNTLERIRDKSKEHATVKYISLSRNFGHQNALFAGICYAKGDAVIMMDADMQHPPEVIYEMIQKWQEGYDIVYTIREQDKRLSFFKRTTSKLYYRLLNVFSDVHVDVGAADFRLIDRKVADVIKNDINESFLFLRGLFNWVGFHKISITYKPQSRASGETKYTLRKMLALASSGIFSFSVKPLRIATYLGLIVSLLSFGYGIYAIFMNVFTDKTVSGWTSMIISIMFIGGILMILLGIIGEYIGRIYVEVKRRPRFLVKDTNM